MIFTIEHGWLHHPRSSYTNQTSLRLTLIECTTQLKSRMRSFFTNGLHLQGFMSEGAPWWKRLSKLSIWIEDKGEDWLHRRSCSGRGVFRETEEKMTKPEWALEPPVSIEVTFVYLTKLNQRFEYMKNMWVKVMLHAHLCIWYHALKGIFEDVYL